MGSIKDIVADRLKKAMGNKQFSQIQLAVESDSSPSTISKAVTKGELSVNTAKRIAQALGVSLDYLYGNDDIESISQFAFDTMLRHISAYNRKSVWGSDSVIASVSISQPLSAYLEAICNSEKAEAPDSVRELWQADAKEKLLQQIDDDTMEKEEYALIKHIFLTEKVLEAIAFEKDGM